MAKFNEMSVAVKTGILFLVALVLGGVFYYMYLNPIIVENKQLQAKVNDKQAENKKLKFFEDKLPELNAQLVHLQQQLPIERPGRQRRRARVLVIANPVREQLALQVHVVLQLVRLAQQPVARLIAVGHALIDKVFIAVLLSGRPIQLGRDGGEARRPGRGPRDSARPGRDRQRR